MKKKELCAGVSTCTKGTQNVISTILVPEKNKNKRREEEEEGLKKKKKKK